MTWCELKFFKILHFSFSQPTKKTFFFHWLKNLEVLGNCRVMSLCNLFKAFYKDIIVSTQHSINAKNKFLSKNVSLQYFGQSIFIIMFTSTTNMVLFCFGVSSVLFFFWGTGGWVIFVFFSISLWIPFFIFEFISVFISLSNNLKKKKDEKFVSLKRLVLSRSYMDMSKIMTKQSNVIIATHETEKKIYLLNSTWSKKNGDTNCECFPVCVSFLSIKTTHGKFLVVIRA